MASSSNMKNYTFSNQIQDEISSSMWASVGMPILFSRKGRFEVCGLEMIYQSTF